MRGRCGFLPTDGQEGRGLGVWAERVRHGTQQKPWDPPVLGSGNSGPCLPVGKALIPKVPQLPGQPGQVDVEMEGCQSRAGCAASLVSQLSVLSLDTWRGSHAGRDGSSCSR